MCCLINLLLKSIIHGILWWRGKAALKSSTLLLLILQSENTDATCRLLTAALRIPLAAIIFKVCVVHFRKSSNARSYDLEEGILHLF